MRPHSDQTLIRDRAGYAQFVADLFSRGLASIGAKRAHMVGAFFVWKSDRARLRLTLDTHAVKEIFEEPHYTQLPSAAAWAGAAVAEERGSA